MKITLHQPDFFPVNVPSRPVWHVQQSSNNELPPRSGINIYFPPVLIAIILTFLLTGCNGYIFSYKYDDASDFSEGYAAVEIDGKWGFIDTNGETAIPCKYDRVGDFNGGCFKMMDATSGGRWGIADKTGVIVPPKYDEMTNLKHGMFLAGDASGWIIIDKTGKELARGKNSSRAARVTYVPQEYTNGSILYDSYFDSNQYFNFDLYSNRDYRHENDLENSELLVTLYNDDGAAYWLVDREPRRAYRYSEPNKPRYDGERRELVEGMQVVHVGEKHGYIDSQGRQVIPCQYDFAGDFEDGLAYVGIKKYTTTAGTYRPFPTEDETVYACGYIDKTGKEVIPLEYAECRGFVNGKAVATFDPPTYVLNYNETYTPGLRNWGVMDRNGKTLLPFAYTTIDGAIIGEGGRDVFTGSEYYGLMDSDCKITVPVKFKWIDHYTDDSYLLVDDDSMQVVDVEGKVLVAKTSISHYVAFHKDGFLYLVSKDLQPPERLALRDGDKFIFREYRYISSLDSGVALVETMDYKHGLIDKNGHYLIPLIPFGDATDIGLPKDGIARIKIHNIGAGEDFVGLADRTGVIVPCGKYVSISEFSGGAALVCSCTADGNYRYGFIDRSGAETVPCIYKEAHYFSDGHALVYDESGKCFFVDKSGKKLERK